MKKIAPSFLSADIWQVKEQIQALEQAGCEYLHLDVMDGVFVPNISFGPGWIKGLRPHSKMIFDAHLMVDEPDRFLPAFKEAGCDYCTVHEEACRHLDRTLRYIRDLGMKPGLALNPATPINRIEEVAHLVDLVLIMSVNPGFGGQKFIHNALSKLRRVYDWRGTYNMNFLIEVDGGVTAENAYDIAAAGADLLVAGSAVLAKADVAKAFLQVSQAANEEQPKNVAKVLE